MGIAVDSCLFHRYSKWAIWLVPSDHVLDVRIAVAHDLVELIEVSRFVKLTAAIRLHRVDLVFEVLIVFCVREVLLAQSLLLFLGQILEAIVTERCGHEVNQLFVT